MPFFTTDYFSYKENSIEGRYLTYDHISPVLRKLSARFLVTKMGKSVRGTSIECIDFGEGPIKILMWSQMHGNESTTTKAVFDLINFLSSNNEIASHIQENCTIKIFPMLNPDGASAYTRVNANEIDLNRDAQALSQPESKILRQAYDDFLPNFCFNLHDQRTMYNVGNTQKSATLSFLAPAFDQNRSHASFRTQAMQLIYEINSEMQKFIPGQVGRYDDAFNANCVGDTFQMLQTPTILFEAGHFPDDYARERTRELVFLALKKAITAAIVIKAQDDFDPSLYLEIPENGKQFFDILIKNVHHFNAAYDKGVSLGIRYQEKLIDSKIEFEPVIEALFGNADFFGHESYDCSDEKELQKLKSQTFTTKIFE